MGVTQSLCLSPRLLGQMGLTMQASFLQGFFLKRTAHLYLRHTCSLLEKQKANCASCSAASELGVSQVSFGKSPGVTEMFSQGISVYYITVYYSCVWTIFLLGNNFLHNECYPEIDEKEVHSLCPLSLPLFLLHHPLIPRDAVKTSWNPLIQCCKWLSPRSKRPFQRSQG